MRTPRAFGVESGHPELQVPGVSDVGSVAK